MMNKISILLDVAERVLAIIHFLVSEDFELPTAIIQIFTKLAA